MLTSMASSEASSAHCRKLWNDLRRTGCSAVVDARMSSSPLGLFPQSSSPLAVGLGGYLSRAASLHKWWWRAGGAMSHGNGCVAESPTAKIYKHDGMVGKIAWLGRRAWWETVTWTGAHREIVGTGRKRWRHH
jgi:hypothetical protein